MENRYDTKEQIFDKIRKEVEGQDNLIWSLGAAEVAYNSGIESFRSRIIEQLEGMKINTEFIDGVIKPVAKNPNEVISEAIERIKNLK